VPEREAIRVVVWGLDEIGLAMAHLVERRQGLEIVGAIAAEGSADQVGRDLGDVMGFGRRFGVTVQDDPARCLTEARPDVTLLATGSKVERLGPQILRAMEAGSGVICVGADMVYPWATRPDLADNLDDLAHAHGVTVLGTGLSPGFLFDTLIITLTGCCMDVERIRAGRIGSLAHWGPEALRKHGIGLRPSDWNEAWHKHRFGDRGGLEQSLHLIADSLGWRLDRVEKDVKPVLAEVRRELAGLRIDPGQVAGTLFTATAYVDDRPRIVLELLEQAAPEVEGVETGDFIDIEGEPSLSVRLQPEIPGVKATAALAVNMILPVVQVGPGLKTMADMPVPRAVLTDLRDLLQVSGITVEEELGRGWHAAGLGGHGAHPSDPAGANAP